MKFFSCLLLLTILLTTSSFSQNNTYEFLRLDMSARAGALAGSFVANSDDPNVIFYNPAGLNALNGNLVSFSFIKHLLDINLASLAYSTEVEGIGRFGGAVEYINYGTFQGATEVGLKTSEFGAGEVAFVLGYANQLDENFFYGANVKFIYSSIEKYSSSALGFDLGLHYEIPSNEMSVGFSVLNIGTQLSSYITTKEELPLDVMVGVTKKLEHLPLSLSLDFHRLNKEQDNFGSRFKAFAVGAEFTLSRVLRLRLGYNNQRRSDLKIGSFAGIAGFNVGIGMHIKDYNFDYGFSSMGLIGALHRISVSTSL